MYIYVAGNVDDAGNIDVDVPALLEDSTGPVFIKNLAFDLNVGLSLKNYWLI
jgi:hypothetical protein